MTKIILGWYDDLMMSAVQEINLTCKSNNLDIEISEDDLITSPDDDKYDDSYNAMKYFRFETTTSADPEDIKAKLRGTGVDVEIVDTPDDIATEPNSNKKSQNENLISLTIQAPNAATALAKTTAALINAKTSLRPSRILARNEIPRAVETKPREFIYEIEVSGHNANIADGQLEKKLARYDIGIVEKDKHGTILCPIYAEKMDKIKEIIKKYGIESIVAESMMYEMLLAIMPVNSLLLDEPIEKLRESEDL